MSSWISTAPIFTLALVIVIGPGALIASVAGARGLQRWAIAAPVSFSVIGVGAIVLGLAGIRFTPLTIACVVLVTVLLTGATRLLLRRLHAVPATTWGSASTVGVSLRPLQRTRIWTTLIAVTSLYAIVALTGRLMRGIGSPENIAQLFDNVYHLNAVRLITDTHQGSSLTLGNLNEASRSFYPAAFHDIASIVASASGADVAVALNATSIALACVVWPLSLTFLATRLFGSRSAVVVATLLIAPVLGAFPYRMFSFGVLYPFLAGLCMLPVIVGLLVVLFGVARTTPVPTVTAAIAVLAAAPGVALTHPSVIIAAIALATPFAVQRVLIAARRPAVGAAERRVVFALGAVYLFAAAGLFLVIRPPLNSAPWTATQSYREALGAILTASPGSTAVQWGLFVFASIGVIVCIRDPKRQWPVAALAAIGALFYFASAALPAGSLRDLLSGVWYRDIERLSAIFAIAAAPLAVLGVSSILTKIEDLIMNGDVLRRLSRGMRRTLAPACVAVAMLAVIGVTQRGPVPQAEEWIAMSFGNRGAQDLLSDDERTLLSEVPAIVPEGETVLGSPRTGASLVYAFAGRWTTAPHIYGERTDSEQFLLEHWDEAAVNPAVCPIIRESGTYWALDFGAGDVIDPDHAELAGTDALSRNGTTGIERRASVGDVALYEATICR